MRMQYFVIGKGQRFFCNLVEKDMLHHHFVFQQFNTSFSVHQSLHGFQFVDIPFRYAICNAEFDSVPDCLEILH